MTYQKPDDRLLKDYDFLLRTQDSLGTNIVDFLLNKAKSGEDVHWTDAGIGKRKAIDQGIDYFIKNNDRNNGRLKVSGIDIRDAETRPPRKHKDGVYSFFQEDIGTVTLPHKQDLITMVIDISDSQSFITSFSNMLSQVRSSGYLLSHFGFNPEDKVITEFLTGIIKSKDYETKRFASIPPKGIGRIMYNGQVMECPHTYLAFCTKVE